MNPPPLLVSFDSVEQVLLALPEGMRSRYGGQLSELVGRGLPPIVSIRLVALLFGYSTKFMGSMRGAPEKYYRTFRIRKGRGYRLIHAPRVSLKVVQRWMGFHIAKSVVWPDFVTGFVEGRSHLTAARAHSGANWVYSIDIENFFPSVSRHRVRHVFEELGYSSYASDVCAALTCFNGGLAQGSPASPVLANLALASLDQQLNALCAQYGVRYTRYADDLVFSGVRDAVPEGFRSQVKQLVRADGWRLAEPKEYFAKSPKRLKVHGLLVHCAEPRLTRGYRNKLRAYRHMLANRDLSENDKQRMQGHVTYADSVDRYFGRC